MVINKKLCNPQNHGGRRNDTKYIVVHYTSNNGDTAKNNADYFAREKVGASAHFFVDENEIWESVPENMTAWHCGAKHYKHPECRNSNSIGVEICMNGKTRNIRQDSINNAVKLVRELMQKYNIPPENVLRHYDVTGKQCPAPMVERPAMWQLFKKELVKKEEPTVTYEQFVEFMERYARELSQNPPSDWAKESIKRQTEKGVTDGDRPHAYVTREEVITMIDRATGGD